MIDPNNVTNFHRSSAELQEFLLFCVCVAGKNAVQQAQKLDQFLGGRSSSPFEYIRLLIERSHLRTRLEECKLGKYKLLEAAFRRLSVYSSQEIRKIDRFTLSGIEGIGLKTASFFILHSRPDQRIAVLDTYVLSFLGRKHPDLNLPASSPGQWRKYQELEAMFLGECFKAGITDVAAADLACWRSKGFSLT